MDSPTFPTLAYIALATTVSIGNLSSPGMQRRRYASIISSLARQLVTRTWAYRQHRRVQQRLQHIYRGRAARVLPIAASYREHSGTAAAQMTDPATSRTMPPGDRDTNNHPDCVVECAAVQARRSAAGQTHSSADASGPVD